MWEARPAWPAQISENSRRSAHGDSVKWASQGNRAADTTVYTHCIRMHTVHQRPRPAPRMACKRTRITHDQSRKERATSSPDIAHTSHLVLINITFKLSEIRDLIQSSFFNMQLFWINILSLSYDIRFEYRLYRCVLRDETNKTKSHLHIFWWRFILVVNCYLLHT